MAGRDIPLVTGEYYHIFNRGLARQTTFKTKRDYDRAMLALDYYRHVDQSLVSLSRFKKFSQEEKKTFRSVLAASGKKLVEIISFVLMPNHFHFLLRQNMDGGIAKYISLFSNSYTRYFNTANNRVGPIFQGVFKAVLVETNEQLLHLSRYVHLNPYVSSIVGKDQLLSYPWSSLPEYLNQTGTIVNPQIIVSQFKGKHSYRDFVLNHSDYARELEFIKHLCIDQD